MGGHFLVANFIRVDAMHKNVRAKEKKEYGNEPMLLSLPSLLLPPPPIPSVDCPLSWRSASEYPC